MWSMSKVKVVFLVFILINLCLLNLKKLLTNLKKLLNIEQNHVKSCICFWFSFVKWLLFLSPLQSLWYICCLILPLSALFVVETCLSFTSYRQMSWLLLYFIPKISSGVAWSWTDYEWPLWVTGFLTTCHHHFNIC